MYLQDLDFCVWLTKKFLSDNGGEFANASFLSLCESLNITVKTTAAESPWSNGICERHNQTIARSIDKIIADTGCDLELALCWAVNAKNALTNVAGFSPFQLVLGTNPRLPSNLTNDAPAISQVSTSQVIRENLNTLHAARKAFIACENDEKIKRALKANIRSSGEIKYVTGDTVHYKREDATQWHGPATVIGQTDQQVFLKHGSFYIRVHPCRLQLVKEATRTVTECQSRIASTNQSPIPKHHSTPIFSKSTAKTVNLPDSEPVQQDDADVAQPAEQQIDVHDENQSINAKAQIELPEDNVEPEPGLSEAHETASASVNDSGPSSSSTHSGQSAPSSRPSQTNQSLDSLKSGLKVRYQDWDEYPVHEATILSRAGKAKGANKHFWNTTRSDGSNHVVDFSKVHNWEICETLNVSVTENETEFIVDPVLHVTNKSREMEAKHTELEQWKSMGVYREIPDEGQECISLRWVLKDKVNNEGTTFCKARLCVRGFEEEQDFRKDSPTCSREGIRLFLAVTATNKWELHSIDVKGAFLQGKEIERQVIVRPPREAETDNLWVLIKCAYGLADAPRSWYLKIRETLIKLGATPSKLDNGIFLFIETELYGVVVLYVDDIMWSGVTAKMRAVIEELKHVFKISHETDDVFTYVGLKVAQESTAQIVVDQFSFADSIQPIELESNRMKSSQSDLSSAETTLLRGALGKLNWLSNMSRPDISFQVSSISANIKKAKISDIKEVNKVIKHVKSTASSVLFPSLDKDSVEIVTYTDASFNNHEDGGSQGAHIVFLKDKNNQSCPITWRSVRVRRVARSTLTAETLAFADGIDSAMFVKGIAEEMLLVNDAKPILAITDSKSLYDAAQTSTQIQDKRLRVEMSAIRDSKDKGEIEIEWTEKSGQLADALTKKGASGQILLEAIGNGKIQCQ